MASELITAPAIEPVTLAECRAAIRITATSEDAMITSFITAARQECENLLRRRLITQTWEQVAPDFPANRLELDEGPVQSVTSVKYTSDAGTETTVNTSIYQLNRARSAVARLSLKYNQLWPSDVLDQDDSVQIRYVVGYGDAAADVPLAIRQWIIQRVTTLWNSRDQVVIGASVASLPFVDCLLDPYRVAGAW